MILSGRGAPGVFVLALVLASCSGGGSSGTSPAITQATVQQVSGTLSVGTTTTAGTTSAGRKPAYVSNATGHGYVYINAASAPNNPTSGCTGVGTAGTGTFCRSPGWATTLGVPAGYNFQIETDNGTNVLAEGSSIYAIVAGNIRSAR